MSTCDISTTITSNLLPEKELKTRFVKTSSSIIQFSKRVWKYKNVHKYCDPDPIRKKEQYQQLYPTVVLGTGYNIA